MISVIIPVFDEAGTLEQLHRELSNVAAAQRYELQMVFVDDGSTDGSWTTIEQLAESDPRVLGVRFRRNFGKAAALSAGFDASTGDILVTIDADLQDSPAEIPKLLGKLHEGLDVVSGWKVDRHDPWHKRWPSKAFNFLVGTMTGVKLHDHNCGLKAFRRDVIHEIRLYGELHRFVPVLAAARGFRIGETPVEHRPRKWGRSKYGWARIPKGFLDLLTVQFITRFGHRPQHWLGSVGLASLVLGLLGMFHLAIRWVWSRMPWQPDDAVVHLHQTAMLWYALVLVLIGTQLLAIGFVAELIASLVSRDRDEFSVAEYTTPAPPVRTPSAGIAPLPRSQDAP
jgi:dolichol-phosphate mannosyltransferase